MTVVNETLKQQYEERFAGTTVTLADNGTDQALQALLNGDITLAAIGRPLTEAEKAQGLVEVPLRREKIAIIVGPNNPYQGDITFEQFARIFRGEITDWSEIGGQPGPIRFVDRPETSDTRQAFRNYEVFQAAPFEVGPNTTTVAEDDTALVIQELGQDGISYAIADQVLNQPTVKIVPMHQTLPDDPRYPFSQPRGYAYRGTPDVGTQAFLGLATVTPGLVAAATVPATSPAPAEPAATATPDATATPNATATPDTTATPETTASPDETALVPAPAGEAAAAPVAQRGGAGWLWLLAIPLLGGLLWWLMRNRSSPARTVAPPVAAPVPPPPVAPVAAPIPESRIVLTPRDCRHAYAYWEVPEERKAELREQGGRKLALRLYDVTDIDMERQIPHSVKQFDCRESEPDLPLPIAVDNRDYIAELGYVTADSRWLPLARSLPVRVPACPTVEPVTSQAAGVATGAALAAAGVAAATRPEAVPLAHSRMVLTARNANDAYAYWEVSESERAALKQQGGQQFALRLYDVTDRSPEQPLPPSVQQFDCAESDQDCHVPIPAPDRDYLAEVGYFTGDGQWLKLARSNSIRVTPPPSAAAVAPAVAIAGGAVAAATQLLKDKEVSAPPSRIVLTPRSSEDAYAYWEVPPAVRATAKANGGEQLQLRIYDATDIDLDHQPAHSMQQYDCDDIATDHHVPLPEADRDYVAEIGYVTADGQWLKLARSLPVRRPTDSIAPAAAAATILQPAAADHSRCSIKNLTVHSRRNSYLLDAEQMRKLQDEVSVSKRLERGTHLVRLKSGSFSYGATPHAPGEPLVLLWIQGGKVINQKTETEVVATWSSLNGYDETLTLEVLEPTTLHAFFFDTAPNDNEGEVTISIVRLPQRSPVG
jgi:phosphate transport system substrate-binding protein